MAVGEGVRLAVVDDAEAWDRDPPRGARFAVPAPEIRVNALRLNPADRDMPEIGDELAVARALSDLGHQLLDAAAGDIEQMTHQPVHRSR